MSRNKKILKTLALFGLFCTSMSCTQDKLKSDCQKFDQGFLEACNKNCPGKCNEIIVASNKVNLPKDKIDTTCKESCTQLCLIQLDKVRPKQCTAK